MLHVPPEQFNPALPGLFPSEPPESFVPLLQTMTADAQSHSLRTAATIMAATDLNFLLPNKLGADLARLGRVRRAIAAADRHEYERMIPNATLVVIPDCAS